MNATVRQRARIMLDPVRFWLRNAWAWPGIFQLGCWWEKRYRPERWAEPWRDGAVILPSGRATTRRDGETLPEMVTRLAEEDRPGYREERP